jgi:predicted TIM-barrel fold metal-dependent hydrolase
MLSPRAARSGLPEREERIYLLGSIATMLLAGCPQPVTPAPRVEPAAASTPEPEVERERLDVHVHLVEDATDELLAALDRNAIRRAVVMASPHLDPAHPSPGEDHFAGWRAANDRLLAATERHRDRLLPFITVEPAAVTLEELDGWMARGACGVKIYAGHHDLRQRPLDDPAHDGLFAALEQRRTPVLVHVNTFRYEDELERLLRAHPGLELVCPHLCGSRTDLDRLERLLQAHPRLRVDTSHGPGQPGVDGFTNLEREHERLRGVILTQPERFLFGSDLVTLSTVGGVSAARLEWDQQIAANLGLLEHERFEFWRNEEGEGSLRLGGYRGLALTGEPLDAVVAGNAEQWLRSCLSPSP